MSLFRRPSPPDLPGLSLEPGERVLAYAAAPGGAVAATNLRLVLPAAAGVHAIGWDAVEQARWDADEETLVVLESAPVGDRPRRHRVELAKETRLLDVIREQVQASVVISRHVALAGEHGIRVTGRRRPGSDRLTWKVAVDHGIDISNPDIRARIDEAVARVRAEVE